MWGEVEYVNRSKESGIDQTSGCCQLSEIIRLSLMTLGPGDELRVTELLSLGEWEEAGGCAPAESHNQIIAPDSSFVYRRCNKRAITV